MTGSGTVDQSRYWIVPVGLAYGVGLIYATDLLRRTSPLPLLRLAVFGLLYAIGIYQLPGAYIGLRKPPLIAPNVVDTSTSN
jgi:hypothetical protein